MAGSLGKIARGRENFGRVPITARHSEFTPCQPIHCPQTFTEKILLKL